MKTHITLLTGCLLAAGVAQAQETMNNTSTTSATTTTTSYTTQPVATDTAMTYSTRPANSMNSNRTMNSAAPVANGYTTTTTTTSTDYNTAPKEGRAFGDKDGKFGIYAGVNASQFVGEFADNRTSTGRVGYQLGIYGRSAGTVFGQIGAEFRRSSSTLDQPGNGQTIQALNDKIDQTFLAIPAYVGLRIGSALGLRVQAGAELSALVAVGDNNFKLGKDDLNRTILSGLLGVGINLGPLTLDAVYNRGLQNVFDNADTKRRIVALNLGFRF